MRASQSDLLAANRAPAVVEMAVGSDPRLNAGHGLAGVDLHKDRAAGMLAGEVAHDGGVFQQWAGFFRIDHEVDQGRMGSRLVLDAEFVQLAIDGMDRHFDAQHGVGLGYGLVGRRAHGLRTREIWPEIPH